MSDDADIVAVYEAADGVAAVEMIRAETFDIVFLDVQMPGVDGFGVVEALPPDVLPHLVFVTAYDVYAMRAFDLHAVDYLLKPYDGERFGRSLSRAKETIVKFVRISRSEIVNVDSIAELRPWSHGNYRDYEADFKRRNPELADNPHRIKYKALVRQ